MELGENGGSEQPSCLDGGQTLASITKMLEEEELVSNIAQRLQVDEDSFRRVVEEEFQKHFTGGTRNDLPKETSLQLKILDNISHTMTGEVLEGINDKCLKLALLDSNGHIVTRGRESSAKVEILLLDDDGNDDENNMTHEKFERSIIQTGEKRKPHFSKSVCISLKKGVGDLSGLKLGHDEARIKLCNCRLGARIAQNLRRIIVHEAWTAPFQVTDKRDRQYDKHYPPSLKSEVWRLLEIGRNGEPCKRLKEKNIKILQDFLFWLYVEPEELKKILLGTSRGDCTWKTIVTHAQTCIIDDKRMFSHKSSTEPQICIIYDAVGKLKGEIIESRFVPIDNLSADKKAHARELLSSVLEPSAFGERYNTEASLVQEFPCRSPDINASTNSSLQHGENISSYQTTERGSSSQSTVKPNNLYDDSLGSKETWELCNPASGPFPDTEVSGGGPPTDLDGEIHKGSGDNIVNSVEEDFDALGRRFNNHSFPTSMLSGIDKQQLTGLGESSSGRSNSSYHSLNKEWFRAEESWRLGSCSPNPMEFYADPPNRWKRFSMLWLAAREWMSINVSRSHKRRKLG